MQEAFRKGGKNVYARYRARKRGGNRKIKILIKIKPIWGSCRWLPAGNACM